MFAHACNAIKDKIFVGASKTMKSKKILVLYSYMAILLYWLWLYIDIGSQYNITAGLYSDYIIIRKPWP